MNYNQRGVSSLILRLLQADGIILTSAFVVKLTGPILLVQPAIPVYQYQEPFEPGYASRLPW